MTENEAYDAGRAFERHRLRQELEQRLHNLSTLRLDGSAHAPIRIAELQRVIALLEC